MNVWTSLYQYIVTWGDISSDDKQSTIFIMQMKWHLIFDLRKAASKMPVAHSL